VKVTKGTLEGHFVDLLGTLRPEPAYMRLFNAVVLDVWKHRQKEVEKLRRNLENVVSQKRERLDRIDEAFLHERSIDRQTYERQRDQVREQLALAEIELNDAVLDQLDIDGVLAFAEHVVTNAARLWIELDLVQKQRLQQTLFPEGLRFDGEKFGTAATCLAFKKLDGSGGSNSGMASPTGFVRNRTSCFPGYFARPETWLPKDTAPHFPRCPFPAMDWVDRRAKLRLVACPTEFSSERAHNWSDSVQSA
jgi:hypothetical protein